MDELQKKREERNASEPFPRSGETYPLALAKDKKLGLKKALFSLFTGFAAFLVAALLVWVPYPGWFDEIILDEESNSLMQPPSPTFSSADMGAGLCAHTVLHGERRREPYEGSVR